MKLYYFANLRLPTEKAHGVQIMKMCHAFTATGDQRPATSVTLVIPWRWRTRQLRGVKDVYAYYGVERNFRIVRLPSLDLYPLAQLFPFLDRFAFAVQYGTFLLSVFVYLLISRFTRVSNHSGTPSLRHSVTSLVYTRDSRIARLAAKFTKNVFLELHTIPKSDDIEAAQKSKGIITLTQKLKEILRDGGVLAEKIIVASDGVDLAAFTLPPFQVDHSINSSPLRGEAGRGVDSNTPPQAPPQKRGGDEEKQVLRKRLGLPLDAKLIGYAGRLKTMDKEKGIPELLEAFAALRAGDSHARLVIVGGDSGDAVIYAARMRADGIVPYVHYVSHVSPADVPKYLKAMDVLAAPFPKSDHYAYAMSPLKIFEYMASGIPMIASDLPSLREILTEDDAFFFEPGNAEDLALALVNVLKNPVEAAHRAANAHKKAEQYTWKKRAENIIQFISDEVTE
ncbi:MAG: glycosyltransferase family 4 protein [bacterium]|nr:glycosyltransferase family 4 protein [bacterium]